jgi:hypothetical protein
MALDLSLPAQVFMPRLSYLSWSAKKKEVLSIMRHFLGPQMREIELELGDNVAGLSILPYIRSSCPLVSDFTLGVKNTPHSVPMISDAVCGWQHLTNLSIPNLDKVGFMHAAQLLSLTRLTLSSAKDTALLHPPEFLSGPTFPVLEYLSIQCETTRFCAGVIQVISSRKFESLCIRLLASWTTSAWQELHTTLRDYLNNDTFESLEVEEVGDIHHPADIAPYVLSSDALRPLLAFKKLTTITYQVYPCLDVDDDFLVEMAQSWRKIQTLEFGTEVLIHEPPRATLKCLIAFARHCKHLSSLGVRMDASIVPEFTQVAGQRIYHRLNSLYVGTSLIISAREAHVAAFVSNLFPELEYLFGYGSPLPEPLDSHYTSWTRVSQMIPVFCSVRSQEEDFWTEELGSEEELEGEEEEEGDAEEMP